MREVSKLEIDVLRVGLGAGIIHVSFTATRWTPVAVCFIRFTSANFLQVFVFFFLVLGGLALSARL